MRAQVNAMLGRLAQRVEALRRLVFIKKQTIEGAEYTIQVSASYCFFVPLSSRSG